MNEKKRAYNKDYDAENMKAYTVKYRKDIYELVEKAVSDGKSNDKNMNRNKWTTQAIIEKLERDGYLIDQGNE